MSNDKALTTTEFLLARIVEDEDASIAVHQTTCAILAGPEVLLTEWETDSGPTPLADMLPQDFVSDLRAHIAPAVGCSCYWPSRVIRDSTAKRILIDWIDTRAAFRDMSSASVGAGFDMLKLLAARYDDHADYRQEWKP